MKKFLLVLSFILLSVCSYSQTVIQKDWTVENPDEWGSFYWGVTRTTFKDNHGKYFYYVYFYSNSLFSTKKDGVNYDKASTYIKSVKVTMYEYNNNSYGGKVQYNKLDVNLPYVTCDWVYNKEWYSAWFWSYSPNARFSITYDKVSAFDYSSY